MGRLTLLCVVGTMLFSCVQRYSDLGDWVGVDLDARVELPEMGDVADVEPELALDAVEEEIGWDAGDGSDLWVCDPDAEDFVGDGIDQNCDGVDGVDKDGDGYASIASGGDDCNDEDPDVNPGAEDFVGDGVDQNCDGVDGVDRDSDGYASLASGGDDCNDENPDVHPGALDFADGVCAEMLLSASTEIVDEEGVTGNYPGAAVGPDGTMYVAYKTRIDDTAQDHLMIARRRPDSAQWERLSIYQAASKKILRIYTMVNEDSIHVVFHDVQNLRIVHMYAQDENITPAGWSSEVVAQGEDDKLGKAIWADIDSDGHVHVAYWEQRMDDLWYATNKSGQFVQELVAGKDIVGGEEEGIGNHCAIAVGQDGVVHIAAYNTTLRRIEYLFRDSEGAWGREHVVIPGTNWGTHIGIFLGSDNIVHLSFREESLQDLWYARRVGGTWSVEYVDGDGEWLGAYSSIIETDDGSVHVVYNVHYPTESDDPSYVRYAVRINNRWVKSTLSEEILSGVETSMVEGKDGLINIFTGHNRNPKLVRFEVSLACAAYGSPEDTNCDGVPGTDADGDGHASLETGGRDCDDVDPGVRPDWFTSLALDSGDKVGQYASMVVDADNVLHVAYYSEASMSVEYASLSPEGHLMSETVMDSNDDVGKGISLAVSNVEGVAAVHVAYYNATLKELWYSVRTEGGWQEEVVHATADPTEDMGRNCSLVVDSEGTPHIVYQDFVDGHLRYAVRQSGMWESMVIPHGGKAGEYSALSLRGDQLIVAFRDDATYAVKLLRATLPVAAEGDWGEPQVVDASGGGSALAMGVDSAGRVHVVYRDAVDKLRYAMEKPDGWELHTVDGEASVGLIADMLVDANNVVHVVYKDTSAGVLKYASNVYGMASGWFVESVTGVNDGACGGLSGKCGDYPSVQIDKIGRLHAVHYDPIGRRLLYARKSCLGY